MGLRTSESVVVPAAAADVYPIVADLVRYPGWLGLVHRAVRLDGEPPAWSVELRARVGPFARSKQLRMVRTEADPERTVRFERSELDGRHHAAWELVVELSGGEPGPDGRAATTVTMHLSYEGALWTGGILERVLDDEIRSGRERLVQLVSGEPTH